MNPQSILVLILAFTGISFLLEQALRILNQRGKRTDVDARVADFYDAEKYARSMAYKADRSRLGALSAALGFALTMGMLALGGFGWLDALLSGLFASELSRALAFFGILFLALDLASLPFQLYSTFGIEARYGFNKTTPMTFIGDKLKSYLLGGVIGACVILGLVSLVNWLGSWFWIAFSLIACAFTLFMTMFYTSIIVPMFNKLTPLPDGELRDAIHAFARKAQFPLTGIFVINGSKRSTKSNAYFSGLGPKKKIVLYDTLVANHPTEELVAILAHEVGHYKRGHIVQGLIFSVAQIFFMMWLFSLFVFSDELSYALGAQARSLPLNLIAFGMLFSPLSTFTGLFGNMVSRKHEYEADRYARETCSREAMSAALKRLSVENLSDLYPHPLFVAFNYSHPPLLKRLEALERI